MMTYAEAMNDYYENWAFGISPKANLVYMTLLQIWNMSGRKHSFTASDRQIMRMGHQSIDSVQSGRKELMALGLISYEPSHKTGVGSVFVLRFCNSVTEGDDGNSESLTMEKEEV